MTKLTKVLSQTPVT